jgi:hypothetical protein
LFGLGRSYVAKSAFSLYKIVSGCADACCSIEVVGGIGRADITAASDQKISNCADASAILVNLIFSAYWLNYLVRDAHVIDKVVPNDADALAENVVVDLVCGACDGGCCRT